jgi:PilZ domain
MDTPADDKRDIDPADARIPRRGSRFEILGGLPGEMMVSQQIAIKELSHGGAQVETGFPLHVDSLHEFRLTLGDRSVVVKGRVAHCHITDVDQELVVYRSGIDFVEVSQHVSDAIGDFMAAIKDGRREL